MASLYPTLPSNEIPVPRCCCNIIRVKIALKIIGFLQAILAIFGLLVFFVPHKWDTVLGTLEVMSLLGEVIGLYVLFKGIKKESPKYFLFYLVFESLTVLVSIALLIFGIMAFSDPNGSGGNLSEIIDFCLGTGAASKIGLTDVELNALFTMITFLFSSIFFLWYINLVFNYYKYVCRLNEARRNDMPIRIKQKFTLTSV